MNKWQKVVFNTITWKNKETRIARKIQKRNELIEVLILRDITIYFKVSIKKNSVVLEHKHTNWQIKIESPEIDKNT